MSGGGLTRTRWTVVQAAQAGDEDAAARLATKYRPAVVGYLRRVAGEEAEDLAQETLLQLFRDALARADRDRGRFRSLVFGVARNVAHKEHERRSALKRGAGRVQALGEHEVAAPCEPDAAFDQAWLANLVQQALARLAREHPPYFAAVRASLLEGRSQAAVAEDQGATPSVIKKRVYRGRQKLMGYLQEEVWATSRSGQEYEDELRFLAGLLEQRLRER